MTRVRQIASAGLLTLSLVQISYGGTISGSSRVGTITGSRTGTITGSRTGTITGSRTGTITGSRTGTITGSRTGTITGSRTGTVREPVSETRLDKTEDEIFMQLITMLMNWVW
jgi:outer membrane lipoprotein SlyB